LLFVMNVPDSPQPIIVQNRLAIAQENRFHAGIESLIGTRLNPTAKLATLSSYGRVLFDVLPEQVRRRLFESATPLAIDSRSTHLQWELVHNGHRAHGFRVHPRQHSPARPF
jgi:hypothetical protein